MTTSQRQAVTLGRPPQAVPVNRPHVQSTKSRQHNMAMRGQVVLVIAGRDGVGLEQARQLASQGASIALHYNTLARRDATIRLRDDLARAGVPVSVHTGDLSTAESVQLVFDGVLAQHRRIDVVVNSVGSILRRTSTEITEADQTRLFAYNIFVDEQRRIWTDKYQESILRRPKP